MILSASRRTDIPNYYSQWFYNRIREGFLYVRNPMNPRQVSRISLSSDVVDCIVFWTKNPSNMLERLDELKEYDYYFQFTLTGYGRDIEPGLPDKKEVIIPVFRQLSRKIGSERVVWRYDPILLNDRYTLSYHMKAFKEIADELAGYTRRVVISFVDMYSKIKENAARIPFQEPGAEEMLGLAEKMAGIARENQLIIESCGEKADLSGAGVSHGSCIDKELIRQLTGYSLKGGKDKNQRQECLCLESVDAGSYDTCQCGCKYCYAGSSQDKADRANREYDPYSPILCGKIKSEDRIVERKVFSLKENQICLPFRDI